MIWLKLMGKKDIAKTLLDCLGRSWIGSDICHSLHQTSKYDARPIFKWVQAHDCCLDTHSEHKNVSGPVGIVLKVGARHQTINLAPPKKVKTCGDGPLRVEDILDPQGAVPTSVIILRQDWHTCVSLACEPRQLGSLSDRVDQSWRWFNNHHRSQTNCVHKTAGQKKRRVMDR